MKNNIFSKIKQNVFINQSADFGGLLSCNKLTPLDSFCSHFKKVRKYYKGYLLLKINKKEDLK